VTAPWSKSLGQTEDPKELVPGNVEQIEANVTRLTTEHTKISARFDSLKAVRVPDWSGVAQESWEVSYDAEVDRWKKYLTHIEETRDAIKAYSGSVTAAQAKAQQAIDRWKKGEEATQEAVTDYNNAVDNYNKHACDPVPTHGPPVIRQGPPGVFVDPGESLRDEAQEILDGARDDLASAGDDAVGRLQNVDGAKTEAQYDFWGVDADFEGPRATWPWSKETEDDREFGDKPGESPWEVSLGSGTLRAWLWNSDASWEDHYGPLGLNAEYGALVGVQGDYSAKTDDTGGHAGGELFGGAKLTGTGGFDVGPAEGNLDVEGWAGAGVAGDLDVGWDKGKITIGGHGGVGWGLGGKVGGDFTVDVPELLDTGGDVISSIGGFLS
jgi:hypothetical protein